MVKSGDNFWMNVKLAIGLCLAGLQFGLPKRNNYLNNLSAAISFLSVFSYQNVGMVLPKMGRFKMWKYAEFSRINYF